MNASFWRRLARVLHRDLGYFFFGATVVYAISGLAMNHRDHWNPSYRVVRSSLSAEAVYPGGELSEEQAKNILAAAGIGASAYHQHFAPDNDHWRVFFSNGTATVNREDLSVAIERLERRPVLHLFNKLHYNPGTWWLWFSDAFCASLLIVAVTGLFLLRGPHGITRRGGVLVTAGVLLPALLVVVFI